MCQHARHGVNRRFLSPVLLAVLLAGCQQDATAPRPDAPPSIRPRFALGPGQKILVMDPLWQSFASGNSRAYAINNSRQITGWFTTTTGYQRAFLWTPPGSVTDLQTLGYAPYTSAGFNINDAAQVVGQASGQAFRWTSPGPPVQLGTPSWSASGVAYGINNPGQMVGSIDGSPARWSPNTGFVATLAQFDGQANDVNDQHEIVGVKTESRTLGGRAFYWRINPSNFHELASLSVGTTSGAAAINEAGVITGWSTNGSAEVRAVRWPSHTAMPQDLGTLGGNWSVANDINEAGVIVGAARKSNGDIRAFRLLPNSSPEDLGVALNFDRSFAQGINDHGHIVGWLQNAQTGDNRAVAWLVYTGAYALECHAEFGGKPIVASAPDLVTINIVSDATVTALQIDPRTLTLGDDRGDDTRVAVGRTGGLAVEQRDLNGDGTLDLIVSFDGAALLESGDLGRGTSAKLLLKGALMDRSKGVYATGVVFISR